MRVKALEYAAAHRDENLESLAELLRIPSISTTPERSNDILRAADWLVSRLQGIGFTKVEMISTPGHPLVYGEWLEAGEGTPTMLLYGHYDVQPTDPDDAWDSPPFEPTIRDGNLYARGASDDKGQLFAHLAAVEAFVQASGALPVNLKVIFEGEEEIGSTHLEGVVRQYADMLSCDTAVISDTALLNPETPAIVYGVRGLAYMEFEVRGPGSDLHSGMYGGAVHNPLQIIVELLAAMHDEQGRVAIPGFYDRVRPLADEERADIARIPFDAEAFLRDEVGAPALWEGERGYTVMERIGARPTLEVHGVKGGFVGEGSKTVIPARASAKVSMRLVPDQDPHEIAQLFERFLRDLAPPTVEISLREPGLADAAVIERDVPAMQAAVRAYLKGFGAEPVFVRSGGTLPIVGMFKDILGVPVVMMGFGLPDDNLHAPNEKLALDSFYRGIDTSIHFMQELAEIG
jgi:acetylornithine deacetylase/succinyl-diaminopimelate desuccinylase-like protein